jgi:hypothetical protein
MNYFSDAELAGLQATQLSAMQDKCSIMVYTATLDDTGDTIPGYDEGSPIPCGVEMTAGRENWRADMIVDNYDATLRLPIGTVLKSSDRIKVFKRYGVDTTYILYSIVGEVRQGPSGLRVDVRRILP